MSRAPGRAEHARRLDRALLELAGRGDDPHAPPPRSALRALAALGLPVRPPYYWGLLGASLHYALLLTPLVGAALWLLVWRHDQVRVPSMVSSSVQIGLALGVAAGVLSRAVAWLRGLSRWNEL